MSRIRFMFFITFLLLPLATALAQSGGSLVYGDTVTGTINDSNPVQSWTFEGGAGDTITISMSAVDLAEGGLDSYLQLLDPEGEIIAENDDASNATVDSRIENFSLPGDGIYTIIASRFGLADGLAEGDYELTLELVSEEAPTVPTTSASPISYDVPVTGTLNRQNFEDLWTFEGNAGDVITIRMERSNEASDLDSFLRLLDSEDRELARNDDSAEGVRSSEITDFELPYTGAYTIVATRYGFESGTSSGDYQLEITIGAASEEPTPQPTQSIPEAETVTYGDFANGTLESGVRLYTFEGSSGDMVTVSVKRASGDLDPFLEIVDSENNVLAQNDDFNGSADARIVGLSLPTDGIYTIAVLPDAGSGEYVLHLFTEQDVPQETATPESTPVQTEEAEPIDLSNATLTITLQWQGSADFDVAVTDPNGDRVDYASTVSESGGIFGGDANGGCTLTSSTPSETVYWETTPPNGTYNIEVAHVFPCDEESPVAFTVEIMLNGEVIETFEGELNEGAVASYEYTLE